MMSCQRRRGDVSHGLFLGRLARGLGVCSTEEMWKMCRWFLLLVAVCCIHSLIRSHGPIWGGSECVWCIFVSTESQEQYFDENFKATPSYTIHVLILFWSMLFFFFSWNSYSLFGFCSICCCFFNVFCGSFFITFLKNIFIPHILVFGSMRATPESKTEFLWDNKVCLI